MSQEQNSQEPAVILKNDGTPYATENAAKSAITGKGLAVNEHEVRPVTIKDVQGFGIFKTGSEMPEKTPPPSQSSVPTPKDVPLNVDDRIAAKQAELDALEDLKAKQEAPKPVAQVPEKYYLVIFQPKSSPEEERDVSLSVNGSTLIIPRNVETIIPERFKVCADNAVTTRYEQRPGESRKISGEVIKFPYMLKREATKEEYMEMKSAGDKKTQEFVEQQKREGVKK